MFSFGYLGGNVYICSDIVTCWLSMSVFWFGDMCAASGANQWLSVKVVFEEVKLYQTIN